MVGYAQSGLRAGSTMTGAQFFNVGSDSAVNLQDIKPTGDDTSDNVIIQTLDAYGHGVAMYNWVDYAGDSGDQEAWIDTDTFEIVTDVTFAPGTGLWVDGASEAQGLQTAGKVGTEDVIVALRPGSTAIVNPFPTSVNLQDIVPTGDDTSDNVIIQTLDAYGHGVAMYNWVDYAGDSGDQEAWIDTDTFEIVTDVDFAPGAGLWVDGSSTEQGLRFPAPEL